MLTRETKCIKSQPWMYLKLRLYNVIVSFAGTPAKVYFSQVIMQVDVKVLTSREQTVVS